LLLAAAMAGAAVAGGASAQSAAAVLGATPWETLDSEPPPKLIIDPPLEEPLSRGAFVAQYRTENFRIVAEVGAAAAGVSPRIGHLHVTVDNLPWHWADASPGNTVIVVGLPPGRHEVHVELADPTHKELGGQTVKFVVPAAASHAH
jgi:hypothetical protein